jgi:hypothetical protein
MTTALAAITPSGRNYLLASGWDFRLIEADTGVLLERRSKARPKAPSGERWLWYIRTSSITALMQEVANRPAMSAFCPYCNLKDLEWGADNLLVNHSATCQRWGRRPTVRGSQIVEVPTSQKFANPIAPSPSSLAPVNTPLQAALRAELEIALPKVVETTRMLLQKDSGIIELYQKGATDFDAQMRTFQEEVRARLTQQLETTAGTLSKSFKGSADDLQKAVTDAVQAQLASLDNRITEGIAHRLPREHIVVTVDAATGAQTTGSLPHGMTAPDFDPDFVLPGDTIATLETVIKLADAGKWVLLLVTGPHGTGKTSVGRQIAARRKSPFGIIPFGAKQEAKEIIGDEQYSPEKGTWFRPGHFPLYTSVPDAVIVCDEFNRVENPKVHGALFDWLQEGSYTTDSGETFRIAPGVIIVATMNEGYDYAGADMLDIALRGRFYEVQMGMPSPDAAAIVTSKKTGMPLSEVNDLLKALGANGALPDWMTMRGLLKAGELIMQGLSWRLAVAAAFNTVEEGKRNDILAALQTARPNEVVDRSYRNW